MKNFLLVVCLIISASVDGQVYFDGLAHQPVGPAGFDIIKDTLLVTNQNPEEVSGFDIELGETKGFGFTFMAIDPVLNPKGAYQEWRMLGTLDGEKDQLLWTERHLVNNRDGLVRTEVHFDTSPLKAEGNGVEMRKNGEVVYKGVVENGLIYTIEVDTAIVSIVAICAPKCIPAKWDATCVAHPPIKYAQAIVFPDGTTINVKDGDEVSIETSVVNPAIEPTACSKVESRSLQMPLSQFHDEGIVLFEKRVPFYAIGDVIYKASADFLEVSNLNVNGTEGVRIDLEKAESFDLDWLPIEEYGDRYALELSTQGLVGANYQQLGTVKHYYDPDSDLFRIRADFSTLESEQKIIQFFRNGQLVEEFKDYTSDEIATVDRLPIGCGKLALVQVDSPDQTICYYLEFEEATDFEVEGVDVEGDEIRILSRTELPIKHLAEFQLLIGDVPQITFTGASSIPTAIGEVAPLFNHFQLYPNPASQRVVLDVQQMNKKGLSYGVFDQMGRLVLEGHATDDKTELVIDQLPAGVYYVQVKNQNTHATLPLLKLDTVFD